MSRTERLGKGVSVTKPKMLGAINFPVLENVSSANFGILKERTTKSLSCRPPKSETLSEVSSGQFGNGNWESGSDRISRERRRGSSDLRTRVISHLKPNAVFIVKCFNF